MVPIHTVHFSSEIIMQPLQILNSHLSFISVCLLHFHDFATFPEFLFIKLSIETRLDS